VVAHLDFINFNSRCSKRRAVRHIFRMQNIASVRGDQAGGKAFEVAQGGADAYVRDILEIRVSHPVTNRVSCVTGLSVYAAHVQVCYVRVS
jgi:hypothetical protein